MKNVKVVLIPLSIARFMTEVSEVWNSLKVALDDGEQLLKERDDLDKRIAYVSREELRLMNLLIDEYGARDELEDFLAKLYDD